MLKQTITRLPLQNTNVLDLLLHLSSSENSTELRWLIRITLIYGEFTNQKIQYKQLK